MCVIFLTATPFFFSSCSIIDCCSIMLLFDFPVLFELCGNAALSNAKATEAHKSCTPTTTTNVFHEIEKMNS